MKNFIKTILPLLLTFLSGCHRFLKKEVFPIIHFINAIKELVNLEEIQKILKSVDEHKSYEIFDFIKWFCEKLKISVETLQKFIDVFIESIKTLFPDEITGDTFEQCLLEYIAFLKTLSTWQLSICLLKTASMMIINYSPDKDLKEYQADFLAQAAYTIIKNKKA